MSFLWPSSGIFDTGKDIVWCLEDMVDFSIPCSSWVHLLNILGEGSLLAAVTENVNLRRISSIITQERVNSVDRKVLAWLSALLLVLLH